MLGVFSRLVGSRRFAALLCVASVASLFGVSSAEAQIFRRAQPQKVCVGNECFYVDQGVVTSAPVIHSTVVKAESTVQANAETTAKRAQSFRRELLKAAEQGVREGDISRLDMLRLRLVSLNPAQLDRIHQAVSEQAVADGRAMSVQAIDWSQLADFIKEILPLILQLISLFG